MPVQVQFQGVPGPGGRRDEYGQEHQHEQDRPHQHHRADETEIVQGSRLQQEQRQEGTHGGDVAHQQRIDLVREGFALVRLVFQVVHIVERVVHGDADDHGTDTQDDERYRTLEAGDDPEGEQGAGEDGHEDPEHVGEAFIAEPQDDADQQGGDGQGQEGVLLDPGRISYGHLGAAAREDADVRELGRRPRLDGIRQGNQLRVLPRLAAAERRIEQDDAGTAVAREQEAVLHAAFRSRIQGFQALQNRREQA